MKQYKINILNAIDAAAEGDKIISVREKALECGIKHLKTQEVLEICNAFLKKHDDYKLVKMVDSLKDYSSLFCTAHLIDKSIEFDNGEEI